MKAVLQNPLYNATISGIIIYILIIISNRGDPILGAILSSLPIGVFSLLAIQKRNNIQNYYIKSEIITNLIIIIMWIVINLLIIKIEDTNTVAILGLLTWIILSSIFYYIASSYLINNIFYKFDIILCY